MDKNETTRTLFATTLTTLHGYRLLAPGWIGPGSEGPDEPTAQSATDLLVEIYDRGAYLPVVAPTPNGSLEFIYLHPRAHVLVSIIGDEFTYCAVTNTGEDLNDFFTDSAHQVAQALLADLGSTDFVHDPEGDAARMARATIELDELIGQRTAYIGNHHGTIYDTARDELAAMTRMREILAPSA